MPRKRYGVMRDFMDAQLRSADDLDLARVADIEAEWTASGDLVLLNLVTGPESLVRRVSSHVAPVAGWIFRGRFDKRIPMDEVESIKGLEIHLKRDAKSYAVGASERWIARHLIRLIPGAGE
jgi:hypothetical protein